MTSFEIFSWNKTYIVMSNNIWKSFEVFVETRCIFEYNGGNFHCYLRQTLHSPIISDNPSQFLPCLSVISFVCVESNLSQTKGSLSFLFNHVFSYCLANMLNLNLRQLWRETGFNLPDAVYCPDPGWIANYCVGLSDIYWYLMIFYSLVGSNFMPWFCCHLYIYNFL